MGISFLTIAQNKKATRENKDKFSDITKLHGKTQKTIKSQVKN